MVLLLLLLLYFCAFCVLWPDLLIFHFKARSTELRHCWLYKSCKRTRLHFLKNMCYALFRKVIIHFFFLLLFVWLVAHLTCCHLQIGSNFYLHKLIFPPVFPINQFDVWFFFGCCYSSFFSLLVWALFCYVNLEKSEHVFVHLTQFGTIFYNFFLKSVMCTERWLWKESIFIRTERMRDEKRISMMKKMCDH